MTFSCYDALEIVYAVITIIILDSAIKPATRGAI